MNQKSLRYLRKLSGISMLESDFHFQALQKHLLQNFYYCDWILITHVPTTFSKDVKMLTWTEVGACFSH